MRLRGIVVGLLGCAVGCLLNGTVCLADSWQARFERICSHTDGSAELSVVVLKSLIAESDVLLNAPVAREPQRKVQLFRLTKCRNLFVYLLTLKEAGSQGGQSVPGTRQK